MNTLASKLKVAILGSGNIGTDLLVKVIRSNLLECTAFIGRNLNSSGMQKALELGVNVSADSIDYIVKNPKCCDVVYDCTSAADAIEHAKIFKDQGIGIPESELPFIYDPFFRASNTAAYDGYGIGLPLTQNIIKIHKGELIINSVLHKGVTVQVKLPIAIL